MWFLPVNLRELGIVLLLALLGGLLAARFGDRFFEIVLRRWW
jgi:hypothetical protein